jgi:pimeloyl-ACP methyl ester carboxylesterase
MTAGANRMERARLPAAGWRSGLLGAVLALGGAGALPAQSSGGAATGGAALPAAITADPVRDSAHPARMKVLHIPTGGVRINGVAYLAAGAGVHPTLVLFHGLPGNEQNLDLAQAVRRAGWHVVTLHYRGSWGSPGHFRFAQTLEDGRAVLAHLRDSATMRTLGVDTARLVVAGHSMGGWVAAQVAAGDPAVRGVVLISAADMGLRDRVPRARLVAAMAENMESLAGVTAEQMADELRRNADRFALRHTVAGLRAMPVLVLSSDDGLAPASDTLVTALRAVGNTRVTAQHVATDHSWSDHRIALTAAVITWLQRLAP